VFDQLKYARRPSSTYVTMPNLVALGQTVWAYRRSRKVSGWWAPPLKMEACLARRNTPVRTTVKTTNLVVVKRLVRNYGYPPKSLTLRVPPFQVTQRHWNRHRWIDHLWLPTDVA